MIQVLRIFVFLFLIVLSACSGGTKKPKNVLQDTQTKQEFALNISRIDQDLFKAGRSLDSLSLYHHKQMASRGAFYRTYLANILQVLPDSNSVFSLYRFAGNRMFKELQDEINKKYPNLDQISTKLNQAFGRIHEMFPQKRVPEIVFYNSGFNVGIWPDSNVVGIGLEWYLGQKHPIVRSLPEEFPQWQRQNMDSIYLIQDAVKGWLLVNCYQAEFSKNVLEYLCFYGKVMYLTEAAVAPVEDSILFSYSSAQMKWAYNEEKNCWRELVQKNLLYSTAEKDLMRLSSDGPFTPGFPQNSAPMAGVFIAWKMVSDYMAANKNTSATDLMFNTRAEDILKAYKGKRL